MDYRKFLAKSEWRVLPYFGGTRLDAPDRPLRLGEPLARPGWYTFEVTGRQAVAKGQADAPSLSELPSVRGHLLGEHLIRDGAAAESVFFLPAEEPPRFAPVVARRWPSGDLLFDQLEFEGDAEEAVRRALENEGPLREVKGVAATLRGAYGYALLAAASERLHVPMSFAEAKPHVLRAAQEGRAGAEVGVRALADERLQAQREIEELQRRRRQREAHEDRQQRERLQREARQRVERELEEQRDRRLVAGRGGAARQRLHAHAAQALEDAGARVHAVRSLEGGLLEVSYGFMGDRFITVAHEVTLQVLDAGICLGHPPSDELLTLDSLPSVIKEAMETGRLVKLRHG